MIFQGLVNTLLAVSSLVPDWPALFFWQKQQVSYYVYNCQIELTQRGILWKFQKQKVESVVTNSGV
jgi:hypothetical protein